MEEGLAGVRHSFAVTSREARGQGGSYPAPRALAGLAVVLCSAVAIPAWSQNRPVLEYSPAVGRGCPSEGQVRAAVARDFGFAFFADASEAEVVRGSLRSVRVEVRPVGRRMQGAVILVSADGREEVLGVRGGRGARACRALVDRLLTRFSVVLHARGLDQPMAPATTAPATTDAVVLLPRVVDPQPIVVVTPPPVVQPAITVTRPTIGDAVAQREVDRRWTLWVDGNVGVAYGTLPAAAPTLSAGIHLARSVWSVGVEGRVDLPVGTTEIEALRWGVGLSACRALGVFELCTLARGGAVEARSPALQAAQAGSVSVLEFGLRAQIVLPLGARFAVTLAAEGVGQVLGARFVAATVMGNDVLWEVPWASLGATAGFRVRTW